MNKIFDIARKDLLQMLRDWKFLFFLLVMPAGFTLLMGFIFGGTGQAEVDPRMLIAVIDQDQSSISAAFQEVLDDSAAIRIENREADKPVDEDVKDGAIAAALVIPNGFGSTLQAGEPASLQVVVDPQNSAGQTAKNEIWAEAARFSGAVQTALFSLETYRQSQGELTEATAQEYFEAGLTAALRAWQNPPVKLEVKDAMLVQEDLASSVYGDNPYVHSSPGMMAQFAIAGLISAAMVLVIERKTRVLARMLTTTTTRLQILAGHLLTMFVMIFAQLLVLTLFGDLLLGLNYYEQPWATLLMIVAAALFAAGLGMLIATLAKTEESVIVLTMIPMFVLSALGGAWMALEFMPASMQTIGHFSPVAWIMDGFKGILIRGWGLEQVLLPAGVLMLFAIACLGFSAWKFRFE